MDIFIYFPPNLEVARDEIEDALEARLGEVGKVTGGGSGQLGSNVDLLLDDQVSTEKALELVRGALKDLSIPYTKIAVNGKEFMP